MCFMYKRKAPKCFGHKNKGPFAGTLRGEACDIIMQSGEDNGAKGLRSRCKHRRY